MKRVVLVDDEIWAIESLKAACDWSELGYEIAGTFTSAQKALDYLQNNKADLVFVDIMMPNIDGLDFIERIKKHNSEIRFIIISGFMEFENARRAVRLGVDEFFVKPVDKESLKETLVRIGQSIDSKKNHKLPDISKLFDRIKDLNNTDGQALYTKYLGFKKQYSYCFTVMSAKFENSQKNEEFCNKLKGNGEILQFSMFEDYIITAVFTDVYIEYDGAVRRLKETFGDLRLGISGLKTSVAEVCDAVNESRLAFFNFFITGRNKPCIYEESNIEFFNSIMRRIQVIVKEKDMHRLDELITSIFTTEIKFNIDEIILISNTVLITCNLLYTMRNFDYIPTAENIESRFSGILELQNHLHCCINEILIQQDEHSVSAKHSVMPLIKDYVDKHFQEPINLSSISQKFGIGEKYLGKIFKKYTGENFTGYVNQCRINMAVKMLSETNLSVREISEVCGYGDYPYFARVFKRMTGISATDVRRQKR